MAHKTKPKFYVVWKGFQPGIYTTWPDASRQVEGYAGARYKSFGSLAEAEAAYAGSAFDFIGKPASPSTRPPVELESMGVNLDGFAVDAACAGVPGPMEYRGVSLKTGQELFRMGPYEEGTNNVGEFLAIVHALALLKKQNRPGIPVYSDSLNAIGWVARKTCRTKLIPTERNKPIFDLLTRAVKWLKENHPQNPVLKWETERWGENPADFGRK